MFTDDNWGNIQRLPLSNETARSGGVGLYYHLQYTGGPKAYKWQNTNNLVGLAIISNLDNHSDFTINSLKFTRNYGKHTREEPTGFGLPMLVISNPW